MKRTSVNLEEDLLILASAKGLRGGKISEFCNKCLYYFVTDGVEYLPDPIADAAKAAESKARKELIAQRKIISDEEDARYQAEQYRKARDAAIESAVLSVLSTVRNFSRYLPENDYHGDFAESLDKICDDISKKAGYQVELDEIRRIWNGIKDVGN